MNKGLSATTQKRKTPAATARNQRELISALRNLPQSFAASSAACFLSASSAGILRAAGASAGALGTVGRGGGSGAAVAVDGREGGGGGGGVEEMIGGNSSRGMMFVRSSSGAVAIGLSPGSGRGGIVGGGRSTPRDGFVSVSLESTL